MKINNHNKNISFKSNIKFITALKFHKYHDKGHFIGFWHNQPNIIKGDKFYTEAICTCTGGGIITPQKESAGFHILDDKTNLKKLHDILVKTFRTVPNAERGLLIGSKERQDSPYSRKIFTIFKDTFVRMIPNVTIFEKHKHKQSASHFHYSLKDDTWLINTIYIPKTEQITTSTKKSQTIGIKSVNSLDSLHEAFENIKIAKGDRLFIGNNEITPEMAPEIFA